MQPLKYIFTAHFADNTTYIQNAEDRSITEPDKRSCFTDVRKKAEQSPLVYFQLDGNGHSYAVDLQDGHFAIDGVSFRMHKQEQPPTDIRLIFWRHHTELRTFGGAQLGHQVEYQLGWQATDPEGKNYQHLLNID